MFLPPWPSIVAITHTALSHATTLLPPEAWWVPGLVLIVLACSSAVDAGTATVPDWLTLPGILGVVTAYGVFVSWPIAGERLGLALGIGFVLWSLNTLWYYVREQDAIGMGDAKWTMMATACFDLQPCLYAWGIGACLALLWMGLLRIARVTIDRVYFAPFLFLGLLLGLFWLRLWER